jgi:MOSC domain-containing protein YiiM
VQSLENYQQLINHETFSKLLPSTPMQAANEARFGENLVVSGLEQTAICIGDVFEATATGVRLQVTSPRLPCAYVDKRNGTFLRNECCLIYTMQSRLPCS